MSQTRTLSITEAEETALVNIIMYFNDMGLPDTIEHKDYETLSDKDGIREHNVKLKVINGGKS